MKKQREFNKLLPFVLSLTMLFSMTGMNTAVAAGTKSIPTEIWVNGADILQDSDKTFTCGEGTAVYEESSNTLTLNAVEITAREGREGAGIYANGDLNIVLSGNNLIDSTVVRDSGEVVSVGIKADGALYITGSGSLLVDTEYIAMKSTGDMTFSGGAITATSEKSNALWASGGTITVSGGDITAVSDSHPALWADMNLAITDGRVNATSTGSNGMGAGGAISISGTSDVTAQGFYPGLFANGGISISGGNVNATGTNDSGIFTNGELSISGTADVSATGGLYCGLQADGAITISGGKVNATSSSDSAIYTPVSIAITGSSEIHAEGYLRALQTADLTITGGTVNATSSDDSAITAKTRLSITGDANVSANGKLCAILAENTMLLSAKSINAYSKTRYAISNVGDDITIGGKLIAQSEHAYAIHAYGDIVTDEHADVSASGGWGGIQADGDITFTGSKIEAIGYDHDGIYSTGTISINGGSVHAKGAEGYAAIRAKSVQAATEAAVSKIELNSVIEKNGSKVAFIDWFDSGSETKSFTTFISEKDTVLNTSMSNALNEVWLASPYTVTFEINDGEGSQYSEKVYPNEKIAEPADPTRNGYIFSGWYNGGTVFDFTNTAITQDMTLTASWHNHTYGDDWKFDTVNHWQECTADDGAKNNVTAHTAGEWITDKEATEAVKGSQHRECTVCKYVMETKEIMMTPLQHTHAASSEWKKDADRHWQECPCGEHMNAATHNYGEWRMIKTAAENEKGTRERICSVCGYKDIVDIPPTEKADSLQTGDSSDVFLWMALLFISGGIVTGSVVISKRKRRFE